MTTRSLLLSVALGVAVLGTARPVLAQTDQMRLAHVSMANQVGVIEYCMGKGWADQAAVDAEKQAAASLPATSDQTGLAEAEATGRTGQLMNNGTPITMAAMAQQSHTTEQDLCGRMASTVKMVAAQRSSMPAMPVMPSGMAMPQMPSGMAMPQMPGMPAMPKTP